MMPYPGIELAQHEANRYFNVLASMWGPENMKEIINALQTKVSSYRPAPIRVINDVRNGVPSVPKRMAKPGPGFLPLPPVRG